MSLESPPPHLVADDGSVTFGMFNAPLAQVDIDRAHVQSAISRAPVPGLCCWKMRYLLCTWLLAMGCSAGRDDSGGSATVPAPLGTDTCPLVPRVTPVCHRPDLDRPIAEPGETPCSFHDDCDSTEFCGAGF